MAERFEDLRAWQTARSLTNQVYALSGKEEFGNDWALKDQIRRAAISVMSNISLREYFLPPVGALKGLRVGHALDLSTFSVEQKLQLERSAHNSTWPMIKAT